MTKKTRHLTHEQSIRRFIETRLAPYTSIYHSRKVLAWPHLPRHCLRRPESRTRKRFSTADTIRVGRLKAYHGIFQCVLIPKRGINTKIRYVPIWLLALVDVDVNEAGQIAFWTNLWVRLCGLYGLEYIAVVIEEAGGAVLDSAKYANLI